MGSDVSIVSTLSPTCCVSPTVFHFLPSFPSQTFVTPPLFFHRAPPVTVVIPLSSRSSIPWYKKPEAALLDSKPAKDTSHSFLLFILSYKKAIMRFLASPSILLTLSVLTCGISSAAVHHVHRRAPLICYEDNSLRTLQRFSSDAAAFCPKYLQSSSEPLPRNLAEVPVTRLSSACTCFQKTAAPSSTWAPAVAPTPTSISSVKTTSWSTSASVAPGLPTSTALPPTTTSPSTTGPNSVRAVGKAYSGGKRGLVYDWNSQDYSKFFKNSNKIAFGSNWREKRIPAPGVTFDYGAYVPTIHVDGNLKNDGWLNAVKALIASGTPMIYAYVPSFFFFST